jgi:hypothetical protein
LYGWLWQRLPGGTGARVTQITVLVVAAAVLLWFLCYPWLSVHLPFEQGG